MVAQACDALLIVTKARALMQSSARAAGGRATRRAHDEHYLLLAPRANRQQR
jgi:hypothetical protein